LGREARLRSLRLSTTAASLTANKGEDPGYAAAFYNRGVAKLKNGKIRDGNADIAEAKTANHDIGR
jgi:hypothetical protein